MEIASISIGTGLDLSGAMRDLKRFGTAANTTVKIKAEVDDKALTELNKHLALKQAHIKAVARDFKSNVIRPVVDDRALTQLNKNLDVTQTKLKNLAATTQQLKGLGSIQIKASTSGSSAQSNDKMADAIGRAVARHSKPGMAQRAVNFAGSAARGVAGIGGSVAQSLLLGVGQEVSKNFGRGVSDAIEKSVSKSLGSTELVGGKLGDALSGAIASRVSKALPKELQDVVKAALGEDEILRAGLFERSRQSSRAQSRQSPIYQQAVTERRDLLRQRMDARQQSEGIRLSIASTQNDVSRRERVRDVLQGQAQNAAASGASLKRLEQYDKTIAALNSEIVQLIEREQSLIESLGESDANVRKLSEQVKRSKSVREQVQPEFNSLPDFYRQALGSMAGNIKPEQMPKLVVDDAALKKRGANAQYGIESNTIQITREMDAALKAGQLTIEQMTTLFHELQHAVQFEFGSGAGITANEQGRILNKAAIPTAAEIKAIAPLINRYSPKERASEVDAEIVGRRMAAKAFEQQEKRRAMAELESRVGYGGVNAAEIAAGQIEGISGQLKGIAGIAQTLELDVSEDLGAISKSFESLSNGLKESIDRIVGADKLSSGEVDALLAQVSKQFDQLFKIQSITNNYRDKFIKRGRSLQEGKAIKDNGQERIADVSEILDRVSAKSFELNVAVGKKYGVIQEAYEALSKELNQLYEQAKANKAITPEQVRALFDGKSEQIDALHVDALKYKKQFDRRAKAVQVYRGAQDAANTVAGGVGMAAGTVARALNTPQGQALLKATTDTAKALTGVAKTGYQIAAGFESVALDLIPMGRSIKAIGQQVVVPAALFGGAAHLLPGGGVAAEGLTQLMGGALSPMGNAAAGGMTQVAADILQHVLPNIGGIQSGAIGGASAMIEAATSAATSGAASALTAVLGGKVLQTAATLPLKSASGQTPLMLPSAKQKEMAMLPGVEKQNRELAKKATQSAAITIKSALVEAEKTLDVLSQSVKSGSAIASGGLDQAKRIGQEFSKAYATIKTQSAQGNEAMAKAYAKNLVDMADKAIEEINKIIVDLKADGATGFASELGGRLQGIKGNIAKKRNLSRRVVEKAGTVQPYIDVESRDDDDELSAQQLNLNKIRGEGADEINNLLKEAEKNADYAEAAIGRIEKTSKNAFNASVEGLNKAIAAFENGEPPINIFKDALAEMGAVGGFVLKGLLAFSALSFLAPMLTDFAKSSLTAAMEMEKFQRLMLFAAGSASKAKANFAALRTEAKALGTDLRAAIAGQTQLAAATKDTSLEGEGAKQIGEAARQASSVFGLNAEEADRVNLAITQMASKGKVSAEELRQQLGEVLPGAFQTFARSIGVTTAQLDGMLQRGEVGTDSLVKFAAQLKAETSTGVAGAANSSQAALNRFNNEVYNLQVALGQKLLPVQNMGLQALTASLEALGVIIPVVGTALLGFGTKALLSLGMNALKATISVGALGKGFMALPATITRAAVAMAPFVAQTAIFIAIADAVKILGMQMSETEGASKDFASSATKGLQEYLKLTGQATDETKKLANTLDSLPKSYAEEGIIGGLYRTVAGDRGTEFLRRREQNMGRGNDIVNSSAADVAALFGIFNGKGADSSNPNYTTRAEKEGRDILSQNQEASRAATEMQRQLSEQLASFAQGTGRLRQVRNVDIQMRDLQARRGLLDSGDDAGRAQIDKEYQKLIQDREKISEEVNALSAQVKANLEGRKAANKQLEEALRAGGMSPETTAKMRSQFEANTKAIEEGEASLKEYGKAINTAIVGAAKLESQLQGINAAAQYRDTQNSILTTQTEGAIALAQTNGQLTPGQAQSAKSASEQFAQARTIESLNTTIAQLNSLLNDPTTSRAFALSGLSSNSTSAEIGQYIAGFTGDRESEEFKILQQAQTQRQQLESLQLQVAQASTQIEQSKLQTQESVKQTTREINDFIRGIGQNIEDIGRTIEQQDLETQIQQTKNDLHRNLSGFSDRFFGDFIGGLDQLIDLINEPLRRMREAQSTIANLNRGVADAQMQAGDLKRNAQGQVIMVGGSAGGGNAGGGGNVRGVGIRTVSGQEYGASRDGGSRIHAGEDFDLAPGQDSVTYIGGVVQEIQDWGEWGKAAVIFNAQLGVTEIVAEMQKTFVQVGQQIAAGTAVGTGGDDIGGVQHTEIHRGQGRTGDTLSPLDYYRSIGVDPASGVVYGGGSSSARSSSGSGTNIDRYMNRLAFLESNFDTNATGYAPVIGGGYAQGAFQFTPITVEDANNAGTGDPRHGTIQEQAQKAYAFIRHFHPEASAAIEAGNFAEADRMLRGRWTSLPGGNEQQGGERMAQSNQFLQGQGLRFSLGGNGSGSSGSTGGNAPTFVNIPGADTSGIDPSINQYVQAANAQTQSILAQVAVQDEQSAIQLRQGIQRAQQQLNESRRTIIDEARQFDQRYQDSILAAFGDSPIAQSLQQLATNSRDVEQSTRDAQRTIEDASLSLDSLKAVRDRIANDPNLAPMKELIPGMDQSIAEYEQQIERIGLARDREQRIFGDRRNAIIEALESSGQAELRTLETQNEDLRIQQQAMMIPDGALRDMVAARAERNALMREFETASAAIVAQIEQLSKGLERLKAEGFALDSDEIIVATRQIERLNTQLGALESGNAIQLDLVNQSQIELLRQYNIESQAALNAAQVEGFANRSDVFSSNELQYMSERNRILEEYRIKMDSINALEVQMQGQAGYSAEAFTKMRDSLVEFSNVSLDNLRQQFPDLATTINQTAFNAFQGLSGSISALIKGTGSLEDVFDSFASTIIDRLVEIGVQWAASQLFSSFMDGGSPAAVAGNQGGGDIISSVLGTGLSLLGDFGFDNGGLIPGRYSGSPDRHIARVNPGEFIMRREAVAMHGVSKMSAINAGRFNNGGYYNPDDRSPKYKDYTASMGDRNSSPVKVEYSVTEINSVRYVSEEQFQRGLQATSTATEKRINRSMRNSPSYRAGVGI
jgi:tape measure domain-containing protein